MFNFGVEMETATKNEILSAGDFKKIRLHLNMTQIEFAAKLGYASDITISYKESGTRNITKRDMLMLKNEIIALGIKLKRK